MPGGRRSRGKAVGLASERANTAETDACLTARERFAAAPDRIASIVRRERATAPGPNPDRYYSQPRAHTAPKLPMIPALPLSLASSPLVSRGSGSTHHQPAASMTPPRGP